MKKLSSIIIKQTRILKIKLITYSSILVTLLLFISCAVSRQMNKQRKALGMNIPFVFLKTDSLFMTGPTAWYFHDYKKKDSIDITNNFSKIHVFISQTEISNSQYRTFLNSLLNDSLFELYNDCKIDTSAWIKSDSLNLFYDSLSRSYHSSETFDDYPVVCISYKGMKEYVNWINQNEPSKNIIYKLPDQAEWSYAFNKHGENDSTYSWGTDYYSNSNNVLLGNFSILDANQLRYDHVTDNMWFHDYTKEGYISIINGPQPVYSYNPNYWGTYNMSGNVAEIIDIPPGQTGDSSFFWTKGGSWHSPPYYSRKHTWERYVLPSPYVGFRVIKYEFINPNN